MNDSYGTAASPAGAVDTRFLCSLLATWRIEVLPNVEVDKVREVVPEGATLTVTSSPAHGVEGTLQTALALRAAGYRVVPHLAARAIRDHNQLAELWRRYAAAGVGEVFIVGGDQEQPAGEFAASLDLVRAVVELEPRPQRIGITSYPEGHPHIPDDVLMRDLLDKQPYADYAVTNLVFDPDVFLRWLVGVRQRGFTLPIYIGLPGTLRLDRLIRIGMRLGLGSSLRYLEKQRGLVGRILTGGGLRYDPGDFLDEVARRPDTTREGIIGVHWYSFNAVKSVVEWVTERRQRLGC